MGKGKGKGRGREEKGEGGLGEWGKKGERRQVCTMKVREEERRGVCAHTLDWLKSL